MESTHSIIGQNMTGVLAALVLAHLESRKDIYDRMRDEVLEMFGTEEQAKAPLTWDNMRACTTMQHMILETARMYPLLMNIGRNAKQDTVLPRGGGLDGSQPLAVPKGASIITNLYVMHRREEEWGSDSKEFNPDRWVGRKFGPEVSPFGGGPRVCIGRKWTGLEGILTAREFLLTSCRTTDDDPIVAASHPTMPPLLCYLGVRRLRAESREGL